MESSEYFLLLVDLADLSLIISKREVVAGREDRAIGTEQYHRNEDRIEALEKTHPQSKHSPATV